MPLPTLLRDSLRLPLVAAPMFLASSPKLLLAQCQAGIVGSMPALNARSSGQLDDWLGEIVEGLAATPYAAPFAINQILAPANLRQDRDLDILAKHRVPVVITSVGSPGEVVATVHDYGGLIFHDVVSVRHAEIAAAAGVDGIVAVCAGAGGHGGQLNPFAFVSEIRRFFQGTLLLSGALAHGKDILAAQLLGADLAYMGTRFLGTAECEIDAVYKQMLQDSCADDIVYTDLFSGLHGNYLKASITRTGLNPECLPAPPRPGVGTGGHGNFKLWKDIWAAGQGVGAIDGLPRVASLVDDLEQQYRAALRQAQAIAS
ncbi:nitronate monooxygenase family protein [Pseudomonas sp. GD03860]|uniref:NAD(P)H-dependent flavin oxidoreductase n=1 Tax=Pseudomonas TaxID=286 RepID=UPI002364A708|nr:MULTISPECIES: nitronate monooxygenase family protein [Pseudomonas]MDD2058433.1 nitronate monooxygenase family protein [Pseudomonas putida]MDH0640245.1 nitronate monooxygenase family protein [Pseudomonas sp. GD03860]